MAALAYRCFDVVPSKNGKAARLLRARNVPVLLFKPSRGRYNVYSRFFVDSAAIGQTFYMYGLWRTLRESIIAGLPRKVAAEVPGMYRVLVRTFLSFPSDTPSFRSLANN